MSRLLLALLLILSMPLLAAGQGLAPFAGKFRETINIGISTREIAIAPDFAGADITIFGALENADQFLLAIGAYDIVVTLEGPIDEVTVRKKENTFGLWINKSSMSFLRAPESYSIASTRTIDSIALPIELYERNVGLQHLKLVPAWQADSDYVREFRDAFMRLKQSSGLYQANPGGVSFVSSSLFQASIRLPAEIPNGAHTVNAYLFKSGEFVMKKTLNLHVVKTGLEQMITRAAHDQPWAYGLFAVTLAILTGWVGSVVFRRD